MMLPKLRDYELGTKVTHKDCPTCGEKRLMCYNDGTWCRNCQKEVSVEAEKYVLCKDYDGKVFKEMPYWEFRKVYDYL